MSSKAGISNHLAPPWSDQCELLFAGLHSDTNCIQLHITCLKNEIQDEALPITHA
jgi:hypothetical protein